jgi:TPR repeat protein
MRTALAWLGRIFFALLLVGILVVGINMAHRADLLHDADSDDPAAQYRLAQAYLDGDGITKNPEQAIKWLRLAVAKDFLPAIHRLADLYKSGEGVPRDMAMYYKLHAQAAELLNSESRYIVGKGMLIGTDIEYDPEKGVKLIDQAARDRYVPAATYLGQLYLEGKQAPCDKAKAEEWLTFAAGKGDAEAKLWLRALQSNEGCWAAEKTP